MFPTIAIFEICFCAPTILIALVPLLSCHKRIPLTSTFVNLLSNALWAGCSYGLYSMTLETSFDYDSSELISTLTFIGGIVVFLLFRFRILTLSFCSEHDSIEFVPSMVKNSYYDLYTLLDSITQLRARPPLILINGEASHLVQVGSNRGNNEYVTWVNELAIPYGSWRDTTEMPMVLKKSYLLDIHCIIEYKLSRGLESVIGEEKNKYEDQNKNKDAIFHSSVEFASPGYAPHFFATTRGSVPDYVKFLKSKGGIAFREILMFFGYHSILECIWMCMLNVQTIVLRKEISHESLDSWTPMGEVCTLDYHNVPCIQ